MKSFSFSCILFSLMLAINVYFYVYIDSSSENLSIYTHETIKVAEQGDLSKVKKEFDVIKKEERKYRKIWYVVVNHSEVDKIDSAIEDVDRALKKEDRKDVISTLNILHTSFDRFFGKEKVNLTNIF